jgi:hypothetical protein
VTVDRKRECTDDQELNVPGVEFGKQISVVAIHQRRQTPSPPM